MNDISSLNNQPQWAYRQETNIILVNSGLSPVQDHQEVRLCLQKAGATRSLNASSQFQNTRRIVVPNETGNLLPKQSEMQSRSETWLSFSSNIDWKAVWF